MNEDQKVEKAVRAYVAVMMLVSAWMKIRDWENPVKYFRRYPYPTWFQQIVPEVELLTAAGMLGSVFRPVLAVATGVLLIPLLVGAVFSHLVFGRAFPPAGKEPEPLGWTIPSLSTLIIVIIVTIRRLRELVRASS
ncbi:MAG: DoxX family protein [Rubrobacteraceae bacterium]